MAFSARGEAQCVEIVREEVDLTCASLHVRVFALGDLVELLSILFLFSLELFEGALEDVAALVQRVHDFLAVVLADGIDGAKDEDLRFESDREGGYRRREGVRVDLTWL